MIHLLFKKIIPAGMVAMLALAALPANVFAQEENPPKNGPSVEKLEKAWAHQLEVYGKLSKIFNGIDIVIVGW